MTSQEQSATRNSNQVLFVGEVKLAPGSVSLHRGAEGELIRSLEDVKEDWRVIMEQLSEIISKTDTRLNGKSGYSIDQIEVALAFSAKGKLAFIAEAGAEASVTISLKRNTNGAAT